MKTIASVALVVALACGSGCARSDWIDRTLVTVDVTGTWEGFAQVTAGPGGKQLQLKLEQQGSRVNGSLVRPGSDSYYCANAASGPIDGTLAGDVFTFRQTNGAVIGELTVSGDEMTGDVTNGCGHGIVTLRRVDSSPRPSSPKP
jgi:hypothetical protein